MIQDIWPHQYGVAYQTKKAEEDDIMLIVWQDRLLCRLDGGQTVYPAVKEILAVYPDVKISEMGYFLFRIDDKNYFGLRESELPEAEGYTYLLKSDIRKVRPVWQAYAGITGLQIHNWYAGNRFCGCCGAKMTPCEKERALKCTACQAVVYPKICPSIIAAVTDGNRILMTRYAKSHSSYQKYALIAGYVEVGESLEDTVRREVMEEVGIRVKNIRYYKSQPWAFTDTLLAGFFCEAEEGDKIVMDKEELSAAVWFDREHIPAEHSEPEISLTGEMIEAFRNGLAQNLYKK